MGGAQLSHGPLAGAGTRAYKRGASTRASTGIHKFFNTQNSYRACAQVRCTAMYLRSPYYRHVHACSEPTGARTTLTRLQTLIYNAIYQLDYSA